MPYAVSSPTPDLVVSRRVMLGANVEGIIGVGNFGVNKRCDADWGR